MSKKEPLEKRIEQWRKEKEEKVKRYEETDFQCSNTKVISGCGSKLDLVPLRKPSGKLDYVCPVCGRNVYYDMNEDGWRERVIVEISEPKVWRP